MLNEREITQVDPAILRYNEAEYLFYQFVHHCGPPADSYFHMVVYLDSFLFCLISIEDMIPNDKKRSLNSKDIFRFLKAARNVTTHHSILAAPPGAQKLGFQRPFGRQVTLGMAAGSGGSARLKVDIEVFKRIFDEAGTRYRNARPGFEAGKEYLTRKESAGESDIFMEDVMQEGLQAVAEVLGYNP